jgi:hypothetical protein
MSVAGYLLEMALLVAIACRACCGMEGVAALLAEWSGHRRDSLSWSSHWPCS